MKQKKILFLLFIILFLNACISRFHIDSENYEKREVQIVKIEENLSERYYKLLEEPIQEKKRKDLEEKYQIFYKNLLALKVKNNPEHLKFLNEYRKKVEVKLNYLADLKEDNL